MVEFILSKYILMNLGRVKIKLLIKYACMFFIECLLVNFQKKAPLY